MMCVPRRKEVGRICLVILISCMTCRVTVSVPDRDRTSSQLSPHSYETVMMIVTGKHGTLFF